MDRLSLVCDGYIILYCEYGDGVGLAEEESVSQLHRRIFSIYVA